MEAPVDVVISEETLAQARRPAVGQVEICGRRGALEVHLKVACELLGRCERAFDEEGYPALPGAGAELVLTILRLERIRDRAERRVGIHRHVMLTPDRIG